MQVVITIDGRKALPVRALPFVAGRRPNGVSQLSPDEVARIAAAQDGFHHADPFSTCVITDGVPQQVPSSQWGQFVIRLEALSARLKREQRSDIEGYADWSDEAVRLLPAGVFVWLDEFQVWFSRTRPLCTEGIPPQDSDGEVVYHQEGDDLYLSPIIAQELSSVVREGFDHFFDAPAPCRPTGAMGGGLNHACTDEHGDNDHDGGRFAERAFRDGFEKVMRQREGLPATESPIRPCAISPERCNELAKQIKLDVSDFMELTGIGEGEHGVYVIDKDAVSFRKWSDDFIRESSAKWQAEMRADNQTPPLTFPCTPFSLADFVERDKAGSLWLPDAFRDAVQTLRENSEYGKAFKLLCELDDAKHECSRLACACRTSTGLERESNTRQLREAEDEVRRIEAELAAVDDAPTGCQEEAVPPPVAERNEPVTKGDGPERSRTDNLKRAIFDAWDKGLPLLAPASEVFDHLVSGKDDTGYIRGRDRDELHWENSSGDLSRTSLKALSNRLPRYRKGYEKRE